MIVHVMAGPEKESLESDEELCDGTSRARRSFATSSSEIRREQVADATNPVRLAREGNALPRDQTPGKTVVIYHVYSVQIDGGWTCTKCGESSTNRGKRQ